MRCGVSGPKQGTGRRLEHGDSGDGAALPILGTVRPPARAAESPEDSLCAGCSLDAPVQVETAGSAERAAALLLLAVEPDATRGADVHDAPDVSTTSRAAGLTHRGVPLDSSR